MTHHSLRLTAAKFALEQATTGELIDSAHDALNDSVYSYSLGELATFRDPTWADCSRLFVSALEELEIPMPTPSAAIMTLLEYHVVRLAEGAAAPQEVLRCLDSVECNLRYRRSVKVPPTAFEPLRPFLDLHYVIEEHVGYQRYQEELGLESSEEEGLEKFRSDALSLATRWCHERWGPVMQAAWRTDTVLALARQMDESRDFSALPILADALQDAACDNDEILAHCRGPGPHVRNCWIIDLLLEKN